MADVVDHPQLQARDRWRSVRTEFAPTRTLLPPVTFDDVEASMGDVPALGQHTRDLLLEAGLTPADAGAAPAQGTARQPTPAVRGISPETACLTVTPT